MLRRLATFCARHARPVLAAWIVLAVAVHLAAGSVSAKRGDDTEISGSDSARATALLADARAGDSDSASPLAIRSPSGTPPARAVADAVAKTPDVAAATPGAVSRDGHTALVTVTLRTDPGKLTEADAEAILDAARAAAGPAQVEAGGPLGTKLSRTHTRASEAIGLAAAVLILLLAFGTVPAMLVPILTAIIGLVTSLALITLIGSLTSLPQVATTLATMIGLGVGIDYALFLITRVRAERRRGLPTEEAIGAALAASGSAVVFAGITVVIALCALLVANLSLITKLGWTAAIAVVVAVCAAVTLLPAALGALGDRVERLAVRRPALGESVGWRRWGEAVADRPWRALLASLVALAVLAAPATTLTLGQEDAGAKATSTTARQAYDLIAAGFGPGANGPLVIATTGASQAELNTLQGNLEQAPGVASVTAPRVSGDVASLQVTPTTAPSDQRTAELVDDLRTQAIPDSGVDAAVGGATAAQIDLASRIADRLPLIIATVVALSVLLLLLAFRSVVLPLKAAAMNLLSVAAAYGILTAVFQHGWGAELIGLDGPVPIVSYVPMMMFAILFGLSMDYEVFLLSRVQELHRAGADTRESIVAGLAATGRIITAAALIMISVFASFLLVDDPTIKMFGLGLSAAIAIDATIVRCLLVPAAMLLLDRVNWWLPDWLGRRLPAVMLD